MTENRLSATDSLGQNGNTPAAYPPAPILSRMGAFIVDIVAIMLLVTLVNNLLVAPRFPQGVEDLEHYSEEIREYREEETGPRPEPSEEAARLIRTAYIATFFLFFGYFFASETLTKGASPGKLLFKLQVVWRETGRPPTWSISILRALTKTVAITMRPPLFFVVILNYFFAFFNQERRAGHDYLARTQVIYKPAQHSHVTDASQSPSDR